MTKQILIWCIFSVCLMLAWSCGNGDEGGASDATSGDGVSEKSMSSGDSQNSAVDAGKASAQTTDPKKAAGGNHSSSVEDPQQGTNGRSAVLDDAAHWRRLRQKWSSARAALSDSPFQVVVTKAFFKGACAVGGVPEKRRSSNGIVAVMEGEITYSGDDLLMDAKISGALVVDINGERMVEIPIRYGDARKAVSSLLPAVRGVDPWIPGQTRKFKLESQSLSAAYCEFVPLSASFFIGVDSIGVVHGASSHPVSLTPFQFDELVGMALQQQVMLATAKGTVPAAAHGSKFDRVLVTALDGTTEWISRNDMIHGAGLQRAEGAPFPQSIDAGEWRIEIKAIESEKSFDERKTDGEDEFFLLLNTTLANTGDASQDVDDVNFRMEMSPNDWVYPLSVGLEVSEAVLEPGQEVSGVYVFRRKRFQRPFRLRIDIPGSGTVFMNIMDYRIGPERSPLKGR